MKSRMDRYNTDTSIIKSRSERNKDLYDEVKTSSLNNYDINSNISVIAEDASKMSVSRVKKILDDKYSDDRRHRVSIEIPEYKDDEEELKADTKEYDINAILEKAKQGKNVDYNKERLKKVRDTQYEILNSLDLSLKNNEDYKPKASKVEEENLMDLINTITELELKNKTEVKKQAEISEALDLLSDLSEEVPIHNTKTIESKSVIKKEVLEDKKNVKENAPKTENNSNIDYDDFKDIGKRDKSTIILKIIIFIIIIGLVFGALLILNNILDLNLF